MFEINQTNCIHTVRFIPGGNTMRLTEENGGLQTHYETQIFQRDEKPYHVSANILQGTQT